VASDLAVGVACAEHLVDLAGLLDEVWRDGLHGYVGRALAPMATAAARSQCHHVVVEGWSVTMGVAW
jgi:hypothetical protein